jgi:murein DD-endopeptidase MepM/ murein hydrolase activator NlpD
VCVATALGIGTGIADPGSEANGRAGDRTAGQTAVKVTATHQGGVTHFFVENNEYCEVTMTFQMALVNLQGSTAFPFTATFAPRQTNVAFEVFPINPEAKWEYSYTNFYKLGSNCARHDDSFVYQLPYAAGNKFKVTQGYNGKFSHTGSNQYAIDWDMPEGTLVHAARGGLVVRVKDDSDIGGASVEYDRYNNYILIRHEDGTLGHYCHLQKGGCLVKVGQVVTTGDVIAHSGNTGFSSGPHLHFCVFKTKDGRQRISIPVRFRTNQEKAITLSSGHWYRAAEIQNAGLRPGSNPT